MEILRPAAAAAAALGALALPQRALALDAEVRAETYAQAYQVRGPAGAPVLSSRRVTQAIALGVYEPARGPRGVAVTFRLRVRFDGDFGEACDQVSDRCYAETARHRPGEFAPLFQPRALDVQYGYLDLAGLAAGALDVRVGRIFQSDALGLYLFDGARARVRVAAPLAVEAFGGLETRAGFPLSSGRYERDGLIRGDRSGWDPALAPFVVQRELAPVVGAAVEVAPSASVFARVAYRRVWSRSGLAEEKLGGEIDARVTPALRVFADGVYSVPHQALAAATVSGEWRGARGARVTVELSRYRPVFDLTSIWASFWTDPTDEARARAEVRISPRVTLVAGALARRYALTENDPTARDRANAGGDAALLARSPSYSASLRVRGEGGGVGVRAGVDADVAWWALPDRVRLDARASLWFVEDDLRPARGGPSLGLVAGALVRLGAFADVYLDVEDDVNPVVGQRFRLMALLAMRGAL